MDKATYAAEASVVEWHWWYTNRRTLFLREMHRAGISPECMVLDVGPGTGTNQRLLQDAGYLSRVGVDINDQAIKYCTEAGLGPLVKGDILELPLADASMDFVVASDIVEHIDDDKAAVDEIGRVLRVGGRELVTVPAFRSLWGLQDEVSHHKRRYRMNEIVQLFQRSGFEIERAYYFNFLLFFPIFLARQVLKFCPRRPKSENVINSRWINAVLSVIFNLDCRLAPVLHPPFGVSILLVVRRTDQAGG